MAEHSTATRKARLIAELAGARLAFSQSFHAVRQDADLPAHLRESFRRHKTSYLAGAAGLGGVLALFSGGRKKLPAPQEKEGILKKTEKAGLVSGLLLMALRFAFNLFKPALAAFFTNKLAEYNSRGGRRLPGRK